MNTLLTKSLFAINLLLALVIYSCQSKQETPPAQKNETALKEEINSFINNWHTDAANADLSYFNKIADGGIYIGTDKTENWTKDEFKAWSKKYFDKGKAWSFKAKKRNIYFSDDANYAWFDELLTTQMGDCMASGVLKNTNKGWEIKHYQLSLAIPNDILKEVTERVDTYEKNNPEK